MPVSSPSPRHPRHNLTSLGLSAATLLTTSLGVITLPAPPAQAQIQPPIERPRPEQKVLTVTGQGRESIPTTLSQVSLGIEAQGKTAQEVQAEIARRSTAVIALLRSRNVEKLETTGVSLNPNYNTENNRQKLIGYSGSTTVSFRLATEKMGNLLDEAVRAGASNIGSLRFVASDEAILAARQRALRSATLDAYGQAKTVLAALNLQPGAMLNIAINNVTAPNPSPAPLARFASGITGADMLQTKLEVIGGEQEVQATVTLRMTY